MLVIIEYLPTGKIPSINYTSSIYGEKIRKLVVCREKKQAFLFKLTSKLSLLKALINLCL